MSNCLLVYSSQSSKAFELATAYVCIEEKKILSPYSNIGYVAILQKKKTRKQKCYREWELLSTHYY